MPKRKGPALDNSNARDIFNELDLYAKDRQFYPVQNSLFSYMTKPHWEKVLRDGKHVRVLVAAKYPDLRQGTFDYWFERLVEEGYIEVDSTTRAIRCVHLEIVEKEDIRPA